jgi:hypothetical protein
LPPQARFWDDFHLTGRSIHRRTDEGHIDYINFDFFPCQQLQVARRGTVSQKQNLPGWRQLAVG